MRPTAFVLYFLLGTCFSAAQNPPSSDPKAVTFANQAIAAMAAGETLNDVTLTGNATWLGNESGAATLSALGTGESRIDIVLPNGTRAEIRDAQTGTPIGKWINPDNSSGILAFHNCWTDAVWFFPALGSLAGGPNVVLSYIGLETRNDSSVQHIQGYTYQSNWPAGLPTSQQLSTTDFYLDATTLLPVAETFYAHPDNDPTTNLLIEVDFSNYQKINDAFIPLHIQKYQQGSLLMDIAIANASFNTGSSLSMFSVN